MMQKFQLAVTALLALASPILAQGIHFEVQTNLPPAHLADDTDAGAWWDPRFPETAPTHSSSSFRIRIHAPLGAWTRPIVDLHIDEELLNANPAPQWLVDNPWLRSTQGTPTVQGLMPQIRPFFGSPAVPDTDFVTTEALGISVPNQDSFLRWLDFSIRSGSSQPGGVGCRNWCQPVLNPTGLVTARLWRSSPYWWTESNTSISQQIWEGMQNNRSHGTSTYEFYGAMRYALVERAVFNGSGLQDAIALLNSDVWNSLLNESRVKISVQAIAITPQPNSGPFGDDQNSRLIFDPELPLMMVSEANSFHVNPPEPQETLFYRLKMSELTAGTWHRFHSAEARDPVDVRFPVTTAGGVNGFEVVRATAAPSFFGPSEYLIWVPTNLRLGSVSVKHGEMTNWMLVPENQ